jgi:hypothetical protein
MLHKDVLPPLGPLRKWHLPGDQWNKALRDRWSHWDIPLTWLLARNVPAALTLVAGRENINRASFPSVNNHKHIGISNLMR